MATGKAASKARRSSSSSSSSSKSSSSSSSSSKSNQNYSANLANGGSVKVVNGVKTYSNSPREVTGNNGISISGKSYSKSNGGTGFAPAAAITPTSMAKPGVLNITPPTTTTAPDFTANNPGLTGGQFNITQTGNTLTVPPETAAAGTDKYAGLKSIFEQYSAQANDLADDAPSAAGIRKQLERETGYKQARQDVNNYTNQLNTITANRDANILKLEGQGRGVVDTIIGGQQAQVNKEAAIAALPVQAQLAAAQGNLELAQDHINTWGQILMTDATNKYNRRKEILTNAKDFATTIELNKISDIEKAQERTYQENQALINAKTAALAQALGQEAPASVMNAIRNATTREGVVAATGIYNGDILGRQAQRASIAASYASIAASNAARAAAAAEANGPLKVTNEEIQKVNEAAIARNSFNKLVDDYKSSINQYGTKVLFGTEAGNRNSMKTNLLLAMKKLEGTGALDAGTIEVLAGTIPSNTFGATEAGQIGALDSLKGTVSGKANEFINSYQNTSAATDPRTERIFSNTIAPGAQYKTTSGITYTVLPSN